MDEMAASIHRLSDEIGENIYETVTDVIEKSAKFQETHMELMDKISETKENIYGLPQTAKDKLAEKAENYAASREEKKRERELALEEKKRERAELMERYEKLYEEKSFGFQRLMKAFPDMKSRDNNETLEKFKIHFNIKKKDENKKDQAS